MQNPATQRSMKHVDTKEKNELWETIAWHLDLHFGKDMLPQTERFVLHFLRTHRAARNTTQEPGSLASTEITGNSGSTTSTSSVSKHFECGTPWDTMFFIKRDRTTWTFARLCDVKQHARIRKWMNLPQLCLKHQMESVHQTRDGPAAMWQPYAVRQLKLVLLVTCPNKRQCKIKKAKRQTHDFHTALKIVIR